MKKTKEVKKMLKKGTMIPVKKIMGVGLIVIGIIHIFGIESMMSIIRENPIAVGLLLACSGYFMVIAGRQL